MNKTNFHTKGFVLERRERCSIIKMNKIVDCTIFVFILTVMGNFFYLHHFFSYCFIVFICIWIQVQCVYFVCVDVVRERVE